MSIKSHSCPFAVLSHKQKVQRPGIEPGTSAVLKPRHNQLDHLCAADVIKPRAKYIHRLYRSTKLFHLANFSMGTIIHSQRSTNSIFKIYNQRKKALNNHLCTCFNFLKIHLIFSMVLNRHLSITTPRPQLLFFTLDVSCSIATRGSFFAKYQTFV